MCQVNARPVSVAGEHNMDLSSVTILIRDIAYFFTSLLNTTHQLTTCKQALENISLALPPTIQDFSNIINLPDLKP
jgi:hypothetical protein